MYTKKRREGAAHLLLPLFFVIAIIILVAAVLTQSFDLQGQAASGEPSCQRQKEEVRVQPQTGTGTAGSKVDFLITIKNKDTAGCGPTMFNFTFTILPGWTPSTLPSTLLVDAGDEAVTVLTLKSPTGIKNGDYSMPLVLASTESPVHTTSTGFTYRVVSSTLPTPSPSPAPRNNKPVITTRSLPSGRVSVDYYAEISAQDPDNEEVTLSIQNLPDGLRQGECSTSRELKGGKTCKILGKPTRAGRFTVTAVATDKRGLSKTKLFNLYIRRWWPFGIYFPS